MIALVRCELAVKNANNCDFETLPINSDFIHRLVKRLFPLLDASVVSFSSGLDI